MFFQMHMGQGQITLCGQKPCHFAHLLQVSKQISLKSDFIHNFSRLATGQGQTTPWDQNLLSLWSVAVSFFH